MTSESPTPSGGDSSDLRASYDEVAAEYTRRIADELDHKPFDRDLLDRFAATFGPDDTACDIGCEEALERDPYPDVEYRSRRAYIFAIKGFKTAASPE